MILTTNDASPGIRIDKKETRQMYKNLRFFSFAFLICLVSGITGCTKETVEYARNPIIWADVPDPSVLRVGDTYYMSSTTMHLNPGVPIMKSKDLVNWEIVNYAYNILADRDNLALRNGRDAYGRGSWASSLRYRDGLYYAVTFSYSTGQTHIYKTDDIENGSWTESVLHGVYHDPSLWFDDDGVYLIYGINDIKIIELTSDAAAVKPGGLDQIIIPDSRLITGASEFHVPAEGAHIHKINNMYYIFLITWPRDDMRTQVVYRSENLAGPYEGKIVLRDSGIAQGGLIDTPEGAWYAMLFQDHGAVGRIPFLIPVTWQDDWPVLGVGGKVPRVLDIPAGDGSLDGIVASDDFEWATDDDVSLPLIWQWNHNPDDRFWSMSDRPGYFRIVNGRIDTGFVTTQNTLTQRTFGPACSGVVAMELSNMKDGDYAGLGALSEGYGFVGVKKTGMSTAIVMVNGSSGTAEEVESIPLARERVYLRIDIDYRDMTDEAYFFYSLDYEEWNRIGNTLHMTYTLGHFMGYRYALFNFATKTTGGFVDFDFFRIDGW
jgi:beta-xylosidase